MTVRKVGRMWSAGSANHERDARPRDPDRAGAARRCGSGPARVAPSLVGDARLAAPIVLVTVVGAASLAAPRRNEMLMTLIFPLAGLALSSRRLGHILQPQMVPSQAYSPPN